MTSPFLSIVTRCCRRPDFLTRNIASIKGQTDQDVEQVYIVDKDQRGRYWANQEFANHVHRVDGEYVFILDDDCRLTSYEFVAKVREGSKSNPDVIMVQTSRPQLKPRKLPRDDVWGKYAELHIHTTNCLCYVIKHDIWTHFIVEYGYPSAGDWHFLQAVIRNTSDFVWVEGVMSETMQLGRGHKFEKCEKEWWGGVVGEQGIEDVGDGDWRLRLWNSEKGESV